MENTDKSGGYAYTVNKFFANADEFYSIAASVKTNDAALLEKAKTSVNSFTIVGDSSLKSAAQGTADSASGDAAADGTTDGTATADGTTTDGTAADGTSTDSTGTSTDGSSSDESYSDSSSSDDALTDTNQTRTIYRNSDGAPRVIYSDGNGGWVDDDGNTFRFANDEDVYDQDDVDYYYHGEAADVYYMPIESE